MGFENAPNTAKEYRVSQTYWIHVMANTPEEAIKKSREIGITRWNPEERKAEWSGKIP